MGCDYDKLYGRTPAALGAPNRIFVDFFNRYDKRQARVLDVGFGQGCDALFIARLGHIVIGVGLSPNSINDLIKSARAENLSVEGIVADIGSYVPEGAFDIILIDRTLHMLPERESLEALARFPDHVAEGGWILIADEVSNITGFKSVIADHPQDWITSVARRGYLFICRN